MAPRISEVVARTAMLRSRIPGMGYAVNPYAGCGHRCLYCYMRVVGRSRSEGRGEWGSYVDVRVNTPRLLLRELRRRPRARVMLCSGTDPYQPVEARHQLTRACLELLIQARFPISILTKSDLLLRDLDLFQQADDINLGITITTDQEPIRRLFEPGASPIARRIEALAVLHRAGLEPYVFVGPTLPMDPENLAHSVAPYASSVVIDRLNYPHLVRGLLVRHGWQHILDPAHAAEVVAAFRRELGPERVKAVCG